MAFFPFRARLPAYGNVKGPLPGSSDSVKTGPLIRLRSITSVLVSTGLATKTGRPPRLLVLTGQARSGCTGVGQNTFPLLKTFNAPSPTLNGGTRMGIGFAGGGANQSFVYVDDLTMIRGAHSFRVGTEIRRYHDNQRPLHRCRVLHFPERSDRATGVCQFHGICLCQLSDGAVNSSSLAIPVANQGQRVWYSSFYFQDDWKVRSKFHSEFGSALGNPWSAHGSGQSDVGDGPDQAKSGADGYPGALAFLGDCQGCNGPQLVSRTSYYKQFGPRLGFAWSVQPKLVLRGGYGINFSAPIQNGWSWQAWTQDLTAPSPIGRFRPVRPGSQPPLG